MPAAAPRPDEAGSLQALADLQVLDSPPEPEFDALVRAASLLCGVPIALISLIDHERQWFKANVGLPGITETPREQAFCAHAVLADGVLEVADATQDPRFADNPLVTGQPDIRFYAGAPMRLRSGQRVGTLCLIDRQPRRLSDAQREALQCLAVVAASALESRRTHQAHRQAMADLAASRQRLHNIIEGTHAGVWEWNVQTGELLLNDRSAALLGQTSATLGPQTIALRAECTHPEDWPLAMAQMQRHLRGQCDPYEVETRVRHRDGHWVWILDRGRLMTRSADGRPEWVFGIHQDISARRELDQTLAARRVELARSNQDLERFAYVASHDLQEPLRMVTSYGQLLMRRHQAQLPAEAQEFVHYMVDGGQRAQALIRDLLSLARIDQAAGPHSAVALEDVLATALRQLHLKVQETGAHISHDPLPTVRADPQQMGQLFSNLLGNALKFRGPAAPQIHIAAEREASAWRISVRDNGIGIEPRHFERVFVMFQRLHLRSEHEGTGIGLAICKKVVQNHGGQIGVQSVPGQGATFFFTLPDPAQAPAQAPTQAPAVAAGAQAGPGA